MSEEDRARFAGQDNPGFIENEETFRLPICVQHEGDYSFSLILEVFRP